MGALNVFCMISGLACLSWAVVDFKLGGNWKLWGTSAVLAIPNLYFAFEPAISGRVPFSV